jgi:hypothetical protein
MSSGDKDQIYGEQSGDLIAGNKGEDRLYCGLGYDIIFAGQILSIGNRNEFEWQSTVILLIAVKEMIQSKSSTQAYLILVK